MLGKSAIPPSLQARRTITMIEPQVNDTTPSIGCHMKSLCSGDCCNLHEPSLCILLAFSGTPGYTLNPGGPLWLSLHHHLTRCRRFHFPGCNESPCYHLVTHPCPILYNPPPRFNQTTSYSIFRCDCSSHVSSSELTQKHTHTHSSKSPYQ